MTYTEAIRMALSGDERGYTFLYEETYKSKMYLAIQYMKNEDDAMDILQDAYVKAFAKLDTLQDPEKFPSWFGMIVANTAKNALVKKNPVLFTDMAADPDAEPFEYSIEDENLSHQPELSYTSEETRLLVREMMDALSEEQRVCVLMFHIDGIPIKEIAETLGCSENTVKSRLNYARKNIKKQGEELQKKGYQLYEIAPFTLLLLLLHKDASAMSGEADFLVAGEKVEQAVFRNRSSFAGEAAGNAMAGESAGTAAAGDVAGTGAASSAAGNVATGTAAKTATGAAVKSAFLSTVAGKITIGVIGAVLIGGAAFGVSQVVQNNQNQSTSAVVQEADGTGTLSSETVPETVSGVAVETESESVFVAELESAFETELLLAETELEVETELETVSETMVETESESEMKTELFIEFQTEFLTESETELQTETESESESESETETIAETESEDTTAVQAVSFDEFPDLLEGNLTKEELEFVLAYGTISLGKNGQFIDYNDLSILCFAALRDGNLLTDVGEETVEISYVLYTHHGFLVSEVNRLISAFSDFQVTEDYSYRSDRREKDDAYVEGDVLWLFTNTLLFESSADITQTVLSGEELIVYYDFYNKAWPEDSDITVTTASKKAVFQKDGNGKYQLKQIETLSSETETIETESETETDISVRQVSDDEYADLLEGSLTKEEFEFTLSVLGSFYDKSSTDDVSSDLAELCWQYETPLQVLGEDENGFCCFDVEEVNRLVSVYSDFRFSEENDGDLDSTVSGSYDVDGKYIWTYFVTIGDKETAVITGAGCTDDDLVILYTYYSQHLAAYGGDDSVYSEDRLAWLRKDEDGKYQIEWIQTASDRYMDSEFEELNSIADVISAWGVNTDPVDGEAEIEAQTELQTELQTESEQVLVIGADLETESEAESESADTAAVKTVADDEYPDLLEGALTKEELEFVLAYGPEELTEIGLSDTEYTYILNQFGQGSRNVAHLLTEMGYDANYRTGYLVDEINRLFSVFTDYRFTEENDTDSEYGIDVDGDTNTIWYSPAELGWDYSAEITEAFYTENRMILYYDYVKSDSPDPDVADIYENKAAVLEKNANGNFQIVLITDAALVSTDELYTVSETEAEAGSEEMVIIIGEDTSSTADAGMTEEICTLYEQVLQDVADGKYSFPSAEGCNIESYYYFVTDLDSDGSPELVAGVRYTHDDTDVFYWYDCLVFDVKAGSLVQINGDIELLSVFFPADGGCFYAETEFQRGTGMAYIDQVTIQDGALQSDYVYELFIEDEAYTQFKERNPLVEWTDISDLSGLDDIQ